MSVKIADLNDFEIVSKLLHQVLTLHVERRPDIFTDGDAITKERYNEYIEDSNNVILLWVENEKVCGLCYMVRTEAPDIPIFHHRVQAYIDSFVVDSDSRGKGIGRKLMDAAKDYAKKWNADALELNVWMVNNEAIEFYKKMGLTCKNVHMECKM